MPHPSTCTVPSASRSVVVSSQSGCSFSNSWVAAPRDALKQPSVHAPVSASLLVHGMQVVSQATRFTRVGEGREPFPGFFGGALRVLR